MEWRRCPTPSMVCVFRFSSPSLCCFLCCLCFIFPGAAIHSFLMFCSLFALYKKKGMVVIQGQSSQSDMQIGTSDIVALAQQVCSLFLLCFLSFFFFFSLFLPQAFSYSSAVKPRKSSCAGLISPRTCMEHKPFDLMCFFFCSFSPCTQSLSFLFFCMSVSLAQSTQQAEQNSGSSLKAQAVSHSSLPFPSFSFGCSRENADHQLGRSLATRWHRRSRRNLIRLRLNHPRSTSANPPSSKRRGEERRGGGIAHLARRSVARRGARDA